MAYSPISLIHPLSRTQLDLRSTALITASEIDEPASKDGEPFDRALCGNGAQDLKTSAEPSVRTYSICNRRTVLGDAGSRPKFLIICQTSGLLVALSLRRPTRSSVRPTTPRRGPSNANLDMIPPSTLPDRSFRRPHRRAPRVGTRRFSLRSGSPHTLDAVAPFAGGRIDPTDAGPEAADLRQAHEEVALDPAAATILGRPPAIRTSTGFHVAAGVAEILMLPVANLFDPTVCRGEDRHWIWHHPDHPIWDAPAAILAERFRRKARTGLRPEPRQGQSPLEPLTDRRSCSQSRSQPKTLMIKYRYLIRRDQIHDLTVQNRIGDAHAPKPLSIKSAARNARENCPLHLPDHPL